MARQQTATQAPQAGSFSQAAQRFALVVAPTPVRPWWSLARGGADPSNLLIAVDVSIRADVGQHRATRVRDLAPARGDGRQRDYWVEDPRTVDLASWTVDDHVDPRAAE